MNALMKKRSQVVARPTVLLSDRERIATLVRTARNQLEPYARLADSDFNCAAFSKKVNKEFTRLGGFDGVGATMKLASFDVEKCDSEYSRFEKEAAVLIDGVQAALLNYAVLLSLFLTVYITLIILHVTRGYDLESAPAESSFELLEPRNMYGDFASFAYPDDTASQRVVRRFFHWGECIWLNVGLCAVTHTLNLASCYYTMMSTGLPDLVTKCEYLLYRSDQMTTVWMGTLFAGAQCIHWSLLFVAARLSFVAWASTAAVIFCYYTLYGQYVLNHPKGHYSCFMRQQHKAVRRVMSDLWAASGHAGCGPKTAQIRRSGAAVARAGDGVHDLAGRLQALKELHAKGLLTEAVLERKQQEILCEL